MDIKLWYSKSMKQWRWTLLDMSHPINKQESGQQYHLRDAMDDVATTVEYMIHTKDYDGEIEDG